MVKKVIENFKIKVKDFPMGDAETNLLYLRRKTFTAADWKRKGFKHPFNIKRAYKGKSPDELFQQLVDNVLGMPKNKNVLQQNFGDEGLPIPTGRPFNRRDWDRIKDKLVYKKKGAPDDDVPLENIGFWNLLRNEFSSEGYELLSQAGGYYSNTINWNAAEALFQIASHFAGDAKYKTLTEGYDQIAGQLYGDYHDNDIRASHNKVYRQTKLLKIEKKTPNRRSYKLTLLDIARNKRCKVYADKIVLAMPRRSLELIADGIQVGTPEERKEFRDNIRCVIGEPSFKLLMVFKAPWWKKVRVPRTTKKIECGRAITDMAMRQCYYFGTQQDPENGNNNAVMLASYNDMRTVAFWKPLEKSGVPADRHSELRLFKPVYLRKKTAHEPRDYEQAPERMVKHAREQLRELHKCYVPKPIDTAYFNWTDDPYGGGYHAWKANYNVPSMMRKIRNNPVGSEAIYVCGDAYSDQQGWVEGALCVAENMLIDNFGTTALVPGYYLGQ